MIEIRGHFDGQVIVPDEPLDLPRNQPLIVHIERAGIPAEAVSGASITDLRKFAGTISKEDLALMSAAIKEGCEQVDPDGW